MAAIAGAVLFFTAAPRLIAQEALRSAIEENRAYDSRLAQPSQPRSTMSIGPVLFNVGVAYSVQWNNNIQYADTNPESDFILSPQLNLGVFWPVADQSRLSFGAGIGYQRYVDHDELSQLIITPTSELAWDITAGDFVFSIYDRPSYSQEVESQGSLSGTASLPRLENTAGLNINWQPSRWVFSVGYSHYNFFSESSTYDYLTRASEQFYGSAAYEFEEETQLGLQASGSLTDYTSGFRPNYQSISLGPFFSWQLTDSLSLILRGGYVIYRSDTAPIPAPIPTPNSDVNSYYFSLNVNHQLTDYISHRLTVVRDVQPGVDRGNLFTETFQVNYSVSWAFHHSFTFGVDGYYEHGTEPRLLTAEEYDRFGAGARLTWQALDRFNIGLGYRYTEKTSNLSSQNYQQSMISLNFNYQF